MIFTHETRTDLQNVHEYVSARGCDWCEPLSGFIVC